MHNSTGRRGAHRDAVIALIAACTGIAAPISAGELHELTWQPIGPTDTNHELLLYRPTSSILRLDGIHVGDSGIPMTLITPGGRLEMGSMFGSLREHSSMRGLSGSFSAGAGGGEFDFLQMPDLIGAGAGDGPVMPDDIRAWGSHHGMNNPIVPIVPLPPAVWIGLSGLAGLLLTRRCIVRTIG